LAELFHTHATVLFSHLSWRLGAMLAILALSDAIDRADTGAPKARDSKRR
jgi:hypothetical protein